MYIHVHLQFLPTAVQVMRSGATDCGSSYTQKRSAPFARCQFHTGSGAPIQGHRNLCLTLVKRLACGDAMSLLELLRYDPSGGNATASQLNDESNAEGKFGIPRFSGDPMALQEYAFRIRTRAYREQRMDESEVKKLGPLGLRMVEGLRGQALRLAQTMDVKEIAKGNGPELLLALFEKSLKPRKAQEARELYSAGLKDNGILVRQATEPMSSYVLRRKTWWSMLQRLDEKIQVSEELLAEMLLQGSGLSSDQQLMVRTILGGTMTVESVGDELLNQHPKIHEKEKKFHHRDGRQHFRGKGWQHRGKGYFSHSLEEDEPADGEWDNQSQSLAGFTEQIETEETYEDESYAAFSDENDFDALMAEHVAMHLDSGLDMSNDEACNLAAEAIQLEAEAYFVRSHAKGKGHHGFPPKQFEVSGQLSLQEKRARLQQLKSRTECKRCGQRGHWSGDAICPKSGGKGDGKFKRSAPSPSSNSSATTASKGKKGKGNPKTRVVYFSMHDDSKNPGGNECHMAVHGATSPAPSTAQSPSRPPASSTPQRMPTLPRMPGSPGMSSSTAAPAMNASNVQALYDMGWNADQVLDFYLRSQQHLQALPPSMHEPGHPATTATPDLGGMMMQPALTDPRVFAPTQVPAQHFDLSTPVHVPEQFLSEVFQNLAVMEIEDEGLPEFEETETPPTLPEPMPPAMSLTPPTPTATFSTPPSTRQLACKHENVTKKGTNGYFLRETCLDCGLLLKHEKRTAALTTTPTSTSGNSSCQHHRITWRGSNGFGWRNTSLDCGKNTKGDWPQNSSGPAKKKDFLPGAFWAPAGRDVSYDVDQTHELLKSTLLVLSVQRDIEKVPITLDEIHRVIDAIAVTNNSQAARGSDQPASQAAVPVRAPETPLRSQAATSVRSHATSAATDDQDNKRINFGKYKNQSFIQAFQDADYVTWVINEVKETSCRGLKDFAAYCKLKLEAPRTAFMAFGDIPESNPNPAKEQWLIAILDSGCNRTCHGDRWMAKYMQATGDDAESFPLRLEPSTFKGINGPVGTQGVRRLEIGLSSQARNMMLLSAPSTAWNSRVQMPHCCSPFRINVGFNSWLISAVMDRPRSTASSWEAI